MGRAAKHKMTNRTMFLCSNFVDFWFWLVVLWFFNYINTLDLVSPRIRCIWIILSPSWRQDQIIRPPVIGQCQVQLTDKCSYLTGLPLTSYRTDAALKVIL